MARRIDRSHGAVRLPAVAAAAVLLAAGCLEPSVAVLSVGRFALVPESVSRLAVTVARPDREGRMRCEPDGSLRDVETGAVAAATADLFSEAIAEAADLAGPEELTRGAAEGAVIDGVRPGSVLVFAEGFDESGRAVARACAGPVAVSAGRETDVDLHFVEL